MNWIDRLKNRAGALKRDVTALGLALWDPRTPWYARIFTLLVVAYAFSPIDLIPDFIPVIGYLDDLVLVPLGIALALKLIPAEVMADARQRAAQLGKSTSRLRYLGAAMIALVWLLLLAWVVVTVFRIGR